MVVFVDLDEENEPSVDSRLRLDWGLHGRTGTRDGYGIEHATGVVTEPVNQEAVDKPCRSPIAEAVGCYPYVKLDTKWNALAMNTLHVKPRVITDAL